MYTWSVSRSALFRALSPMIAWIATSGCGAGASVSDGARHDSAAGGSAGGATAASAGQLNLSAGGFTLGAAGTGGAGPATAGGDSGGASAGGLSELSAAYCAAALQCCADPGFNNNHCESYTQVKLTTVLEDPLVTIDPAALTRCIAAYRSAAPDCARSKIMAACRGMIVPTQALGAACSLDQACKTDQGAAFCANRTSQGSEPARGTCSLVPHLAIGDTCQVTYEKQTGPELSGHWELGLGIFQTYRGACFESDGLTCGLNDPVTGLHCEVPISRGNRCVDLSECAFTDTCAADQTCQARAKEGEPCGAGCLRELECVSGVCRQRRLGDSFYLWDESCNSTNAGVQIDYLAPLTW
jgi:hypothetical protein